MPEPRYKSRSKRRVYVKTPSGKTKLTYRKRKPAKAKCSICQKPLIGISNIRASKLHRIAKTKKRPSRPYGGKLCSRCMRKILIEGVQK